MATRAKSSTTPSRDSTPESPISTPPGMGVLDHNFSLQILMDLQKSVASLQTSVDGVKESISDVKTSVDSAKAKAAETDSKVLKVEKLLYAASAVGVLVVSVSVWTLNTAKDLGMVYYKAAVEAALRQGSVTPPPPPPTKQK